MMDLASILVLLAGERAETEAHRVAMRDQLARLSHDLEVLNTRDRALSSAITALQSIPSAPVAAMGDADERTDPTYGYFIGGFVAAHPETETAPAAEPVEELPAAAENEPAADPVDGLAWEPEPEPADIMAAAPIAPAPEPAKPSPAEQAATVPAARRVADLIASSLDRLLQEYPDGPRIGDIADEYRVTERDARGAINLLQREGKAAYNLRKSTGFRHLMRVGEQP